MNKFYISSLSYSSWEDETLLYPYFTFRVNYIRPEGKNYYYDKNTKKDEYFNIPIIVISEEHTELYSLESIK